MATLLKKHDREDFVDHFVKAVPIKTLCETEAF